MEAKITHLSERGVEQAKQKIAGLKANIDELTEQLKAKDRELEIFRKRASEEPPETFSQAWAQENRSVVKLIARTEAERVNLIRSKQQAIEAHKSYLVQLEQESERQFAADRIWWSNRRRDWESRTRQEKVSEAHGVVDSVVARLNVKVDSEEVADRVRQAIADVDSPEVQEALKVTGSSTPLNLALEQARKRLVEWHGVHG